jgi:hypothetical protein
VQRTEHLLYLLSVGADVAVDKLAVVFESV